MQGLYPHHCSNAERQTANIAITEDLPPISAFTPLAGSMEINGFAAKFMKLSPKLRPFRVASI